MSTVKTLLKEEGATGIWKGFGPTLVGYSAQGMFKFGLYEVFKDQYANLAGKENAQKYKSAIWLAGSASAEVFADIALCPFEMTKVKIQTSPVGTFPTAFGAAITAMSKNRVETKYPFGSLVPLWSRQVNIAFHECYLQCSSQTILDSIHHGQILLLRKDRPSLLHTRAIGAKIHL